MTLFQDAILAVQLAGSDPQTRATPAAEDVRTEAATEAHIPSQAELDSWEAAQAAADAAVYSYEINAWRYGLEEEMATPVEDCAKVEIADQHLSRVTRQVRRVLDMLDAEIQTGHASPRVRAAYAALVQDEDMNIGREMVQRLVDSRCAN